MFLSKPTFSFQSDSVLMNKHDNNEWVFGGMPVKGIRTITVMNDVINNHISSVNIKAVCFVQLPVCFIQLPVDTSVT